MSQNSANFPKYILSVRPLGNINVSKFFEEGNPLFVILKDPLYLRYSGWNTLTKDFPKLRGGEFWEVRNGDKKVLRAYSDASFISMVSASEDFLGWGVNEKNTDEGVLINTLAIVEYTYEFVSTYNQMLKKLNIGDFMELEFIISMRDIVFAANKKLVLVAGRIKDPFYPLAIHEKGETMVDFSKALRVTIEKSKFDVGLITFKILEIVFAHFGIASNNIPYISINPDTNVKFVDIAEILKQ